MMMFFNHKRGILEEIGTSETSFSLFPVGWMYFDVMMRLQVPPSTLFETRAIFNF